MASSSSSSKAQPAAAGKAAAATGQTPLQPVRLNPTAASRAARHVLPPVLAALFFAGLPRLVADPVSIMWASLPVVAFLQVLYAAVCLPMAGSGAARARKHRPGDKKKAADASGPGLVVVSYAYLPETIRHVPPD